MSKDIELGKRIAWLRTNDGLEQKAAAEAIGLLYTTYQKYEYGNCPSRKNLEKLLKKYACAKSWLLTGEGVPYPSGGPEPFAGPAYIRDAAAPCPSAECGLTNPESPNNVVYLNPAQRILEESLQKIGKVLTREQKIVLIEMLIHDLKQAEREAKDKIINIIKVFKDQPG